jgi:hypothetical protein
MKAEHFPAALEALKELCTTNTYFSWVDSRTAIESATLSEIMDELRWELCIDADGNVEHISFQGDKSGDDFEFFKVLAPYVDKGSYISMRGEDGALWRWYFNGKECIEQYGHISYGYSEIADYLGTIAVALDLMERSVTNEGTPKENRYIELSDTLATNISKHLREIQKELSF